MNESAQTIINKHDLNELRQLQDTINQIDT